jgi:putative ABC transport system permease protein
VIILLVVALSATNTMLMAVTERIQEMGTMLALGIGRTRIRINFAVEGAMIGGLSGAVGLAGAAALSLGINLAGIEMPPPPGRTMPYPLIILVDATAYTGVFAAMVLAGAAAAWAPTARLGRLRIVDALRRS